MVQSRESKLLFVKLETATKDLQQISDEKNILQIRHDALTSESAQFYRRISRPSKQLLRI